MNYLHIIYLQIKFYNIRKRRCYFMLIAKINIYRVCYGFGGATRQGPGYVLNGTPKPAAKTVPIRMNQNRYQISIVSFAHAMSTIMIPKPFCNGCLSATWIQLAVV